MIPSARFEFQCKLIPTFKGIFSDNLKKAEQVVMLLTCHSTMAATDFSSTTSGCTYAGNIPVVNC
jgi:hypothetical protein